MASKRMRRLGLERLEDRSLMSTGVQQVVVMSQNLYFGADTLGAAVCAALGGPLAAIPANTQVWQDVQKTNFSERAEAIAAQIVANKVDLVGLQEVMLFQTGVPDSLIGNPTQASKVELDFLQILLDKLAAKGAAYSAVQVHDVGATETAAFVQGVLKDIRATDRLAILARSSLTGPQMQITDKKGANFVVKVSLSVPGGGTAQLERGWNSVDVAWNGAKFRFINMCLEVPVFPVHQAYQAVELLVGPA